VHPPIRCRATEDGPALGQLDRLAAEFDRNRIDLHVPGAVLAIVRGDGDLRQRIWAWRT
jgi:hypothetical protein